MEKWKIRKRYILPPLGGSLFIILYIILSFSTISFAAGLDIDNGCAYILMDAKSGQVILEQNADVKMRPASTTKIMTAIVALENGSLNEIMTVSHEAVRDIGPGGMNVGIMAGEENLTLENLLNVMLVKSANETANIIAENIGGTRDEFIDMMNQKAVELGALNTHFVNANGKDNLEEEASHLSTARDMAAIARYAMTIPKFREIVSKEYYEDMPITNKHKSFGALRITNKLIWPENRYSYIIDNQKFYYAVNGVKTGYTSAAGSNLVSSAINENGMELIGVVLRVRESYDKVFQYSTQLLKYGFGAFDNQKIVEENQIYKAVIVENAKDEGSLDLLTATDVICALPVDRNNWNLQAKENIKLPIKAPVKKGDILGYIEYERDGVIVGRTELLASRDVDGVLAKSVSESKKLVITLLRVIMIIIIALFAMLLVLRVWLIIRIKKRKRNAR